MKSYYAVVGRISFDDEDTVEFYYVESSAEAMKLFARDMYESRNFGPEKVKFLESMSEGVIVNHIIVSATQLTEV